MKAVPVDGGPLGMPPLPNNDSKPSPVPSKKMRHLHWNKFNVRQAKGTVWENLPDIPFEVKNLNFFVF